MSIDIKKDFDRNRNRKSDISNLVFGKIPPQAPDLEEAVLGAAMLEKETFTQVVDVINSADCFYLDAHQKIYAAMRRVYDKGTPVDLLTITEELRKSNELEIVGGAYYLTRLTMSVLSSAHVEAHARIVMEKHMQREVIRICGAALSDAYEDSTDVLDLLDAVEGQIKSITAGISGFEEVHIGAAYGEVVERYNMQKKSKSELIGIDTGFTDLNSMTGGFRSPGLVIVAAYPSEGKTALMLELARKIERLNKIGRCKIYSLETGHISLTSRMAASEVHIPFDALQKGNLNVYEEEALYKGMSNFNTKRISISTKLFFIEDICKSARKLKKKHPDLGAIFLDFIQLVKVRNAGKMDKNELVGYVSRELKLLSSELGVPVIALSQLNRDGKKNPGKRPQPENLARSSELEQNADVIIFIWYKDSGDGGDPQPHLIVAKNKDGKTGDMRVKSDSDFQTWGDYDPFSSGKLPSFVDTNIRNGIINKQPTKDDDVPF